MTSHDEKSIIQSKFYTWSGEVIGRKKTIFTVPVEAHPPKTGCESNGWVKSSSFKKLKLIHVHPMHVLRSSKNGCLNKFSEPMSW